MYDKTWLNTDGVYSTITGFLTAPSSGLYVFSWTSFVAEMSKFNSELLVNGERIDLTNCDNELDTQGFESCSNTVPVILKKGDMVNIRTVDAISLRGDQLSSFKGWRVRWRYMLFWVLDIFPYIFQVSLYMILNVNHNSFLITREFF